MPIVILVISFLTLLFLITKARVNAFFALLIAAVMAALLNGMASAQIIKSLTTGLGDTLGNLILIITFGAMLGKLLQTSGAANKITRTLVARFGERNIQISIIVAGFIIGIPMMYNASFLVLIPIIYSLSFVSKIPLLQLGIPLSASLSVAHGYLPPHPAPVVVADMFKADVNTVFLYGLLLSPIAIIVSGLILPRFFRNVHVSLPEKLFSVDQASAPQEPGFLVSLLCAVFPFILMVAAALAPKELSLIQLVGNPNISLFLSVVLAFVLLHLRKGRNMSEVMSELNDAAASIVMIILIIGAGGAFKQVLVDSGSTVYLGEYVIDSNLNPLFLGWCLAAVIRALVGSATVATISAAGILAPMVIQSNIPKELMVIAVGSGSLMFSHFNDIGFWMFKEYYNVSVKQTFQIWTVMECLVGIIGILGAFALQYLFY